MKKILGNNRLAILAFTVFSFISVSAAPIKDSNSNYVIPVQLKFVGNLNNQPLFQLSFSGTGEPDEFTIDIRDDYGNSLYRETIKGDIFSKKFLLNTDELGDARLRFEISSKRSKKPVVYEIDRTTHYVQETVVRELK
jgi:hypothetical protein